MKFYKGILNAWMLSVLFWSILAFAVFAQPTARITGPSQVPPGELTALSSTGSTGDNLIWIRPDGLATIQSGCEAMDQQLFFSTTRQGKYEFVLVVADKEARIAYAKHVVTVGNISPPTDPNPPTDPTPTPAKWEGLVDVSKKAADAINDLPTRSSLKTNLSVKISDIESRCKVQQCPTLLQAQTEVSNLLNALILKSPDRFSPWNGWRISISEYIKAKGIVDLPDYLNAVKAYANGL